MAVGSLEISFSLACLEVQDCDTYKSIS